MSQFPVFFSHAVRLSFLVRYQAVSARTRYVWCVVIAFGGVRKGVVCGRWVVVGRCVEDSVVLGRANFSGASPNVALHCSDTTVQVSNARLEALDNLANATHFVEFDLQLVDFTQDGAEAGDFCVGVLDGVARAVVLDLGCGSGLLCELAGCGLACRSMRIARNGCRQQPRTYILPSRLDRVHQTVKVGAERL